MSRLERDLASLQESISLASRLADSIQTTFKQLRAGNIESQAICIFLDGPLGAGKTEWCRQIICSLGFEGQVTSPTYGLIETYRIRSKSITTTPAIIAVPSNPADPTITSNTSAKKRSLVIHHIDAYRLKDAQELLQIGIDEYTAEAQLVLVEWGRVRGCAEVLTPDISILLQDDVGNSSSIGGALDVGEGESAVKGASEEAIKNAEMASAQEAGHEADNGLRQQRQVSIQAHTAIGRLVLQSL